MILMKPYSLNNKIIFEINKNNNFNFFTNIFRAVPCNISIRHLVSFYYKKSQLLKIQQIIYTDMNIYLRKLLYHFLKL